jgi:hypothetical protein
MTTISRMTMEEMEAGLEVVEEEVEASPLAVLK